MGWDQGKVLVHLVEDKGEEGRFSVGWLVGVRGVAWGGGGGEGWVV